MFQNILDEKEFLDNKKIDFTYTVVAILDYFQPRHAFSQKPLFLGKTAQKKRFLDVLHRQEAKISIVTRLDFFQRGQLMLLVKNLKFLDCFFLGTCIKALEKRFLMFQIEKKPFQKSKTLGPLCNQTVNLKTGLKVSD